MKQFDIKRFGWMLKNHFCVTRNTWLGVFGVYTLVLFLADLFITRVQGINYSEELEHVGIDVVREMYASQVNGSADFGQFFFLIAMMICASLIFSHLKTNARRSTFLTLPASNLEKYLACFLHVVVSVGVGTFVAYCIADGLRVLTDLLTGRVVIWGVPYFFDAHNAYHWPWGVWMIGWLIYFHSVYILGGALFRRLAFVLTSVLVVIGFFLVMWGVRATVGIIDWQSFPIYTTADGKAAYHWLFYVFLVLIYLLAAVHYWLSYRIFCRMQVISRKYLNI